MNEETVTVLRSLLKCGRMVESRLDSLLDDVDLSTTKMLTLRHLNQAEEPQSLGQLANSMSFAKSNATQLVDNLESANLVRRVPDPRDRRCTLLDLTPEGKQHHDSALKAAQPLLDQLAALYTPEEQAMLAALLLRLSDSLK